MRELKKWPEPSKGCRAIGKKDIKAVLLFLSLAYFPYVENIKAVLRDHDSLRASVCLCIPPMNFSVPEPIYIKLGIYIMAPESISTA
jgi:hypothetical protein